VTGHEEERNLVAQLLRREPVAVLLGLDQGREQVIGRIQPLPLDDRVEVSVERGVGREGRGQLVVTQDRIERLHYRAGPFADLILVGLGHSQHLGDDVEGKRERQSVDDIGDAFGRHRVERLLDHLLDPRPQRLDRPRREGLAHEPAKPRVVGWVHAQNRFEFLELLESVGQIPAGHLPKVGVGIVDAQRRGRSWFDASGIASAQWKRSSLPGTVAGCR